MLIAYIHNVQFGSKYCCCQLPFDANEAAGISIELSACIFEGNFTPASDFPISVSSDKQQEIYEVKSILVYKCLHFIL
jgi:hypothetical protein